MHYNCFDFKKHDILFKLGTGKKENYKENMYQYMFFPLNEHTQLINYSF